MTIVDQLNNRRSVMTKDKNYNITGREYWIQNAQNSNNTQLYNASDVVVHQIDGPLYYEKSQLTKWEDEVEKLVMSN